MYRDIESKSVFYIVECHLKSNWNTNFRFDRGSESVERKQRSVRIFVMNVLMAVKPIFFALFNLDDKEVGMFVTIIVTIYQDTQNFFNDLINIISVIIWLCVKIDNSS